MGGQQFLSGGIALDITGLNQVSHVDHELGLVTAGGGVMWPMLIAATRADDHQPGPRWAIRQKQTGADDLTLAGSVSCNAHGRGLTFAPLVDDVESLRVVLPDGTLQTCSREHHPELFGLVVGGYGLFGVIAEVTPRLVPRTLLKRRVDVIDLDDAMHAVRRRVAEGCTYGDFQYAIDPADDSFLRRGVFACYAPAGGAAADDEPADLSRDRWLVLLDLAHRDKRRAFQLYSEHYLSTHGRTYWSDTMQLSTYIPSYADYLATIQGRPTQESLVISELYVPPPALPEFMTLARGVLRDDGAEDI